MCCRCLPRWCIGRRRPAAPRRPAVVDAIICSALTGSRREASPAVVGVAEPVVQETHLAQARQSCSTAYARSRSVSTDVGVSGIAAGVELGGRSDASPRGPGSGTAQADTDARLLDALDSTCLWCASLCPSDEHGPLPPGVSPGGTMTSATARSALHGCCGSGRTEAVAEAIAPDHHLAGSWCEASCHLDEASCCWPLRCCP